MAKYKIEVELDIDFQKFFNNIPDGLYKNKEGCDEYYELDSINNVLNKIHTNALINKTNWMTKDHYKYAEHHILIEEEISKQLSEKYKITKQEQPQALHKTDINCNLLSYEEATTLSLKTKWKVIPCISGEQCWCRIIVPEIEIKDKDGNEIYIVGSGCIPKVYAEHIVKLHNESLNCI